MNGQSVGDTDRQPIGEIGVERDRGDVRVRIEPIGGGGERFYLPPERAMQVAMWLQQAATDAKQWERQEGSQ